MEKLVFGIDIGGTYIKYGLFDETGILLKEWKDETVRGDRLFGVIAASADRCINEEGLDRRRIAGIGLSVPGPVDRNGNLYHAPNINWRDINIPARFKALTDIRVYAVNDGSAAALGEAWKGSAKGVNDFVLVTLGTGIGGGIMANGSIITGAKGSAGEIGHIHLMDEDTPAESNGLKGSFEYYASATGLIRLAKERLKSDPQKSMLREGPLEASAVFTAAAQGDYVARDIVSTYGNYLGKGLACLATILGPDVIIFGGGMSEAGDMLVECAKPAFHEYAYPLVRETEIRLAKLGNRAGMIGAAKAMLGIMDPTK